MAKKHQPGQLGLFKPDTDWVAPTELPDLRGRPLVAIDSETKDDGLANDLGPGWALGPMGYIAGVSFAAEGVQGYVPVQHPETDNFPLDNVMRWLDDHFKFGTRIVFHNGPYDTGWFGCHGVAPPVNFEDTQPACVMLDETKKRYNLDACCKRYGVPGKDTGLLLDAIEAYGGNRSKGAADIWRLPARYAGPYAEADAVATLNLWRQVEGQLRAQEVWDAYRTEIDLIPMVVAMRRRGIRIDSGMALQTKREFLEVRDESLKEIGGIIGLRRDASVDEVRSPRTLENWFHTHNISFPRTSGGKTGRSQGSFSADWMEKHEHPLARAVTKARQFDDAAFKFIDNFLLGFSHKGRIHAEIHQFLSDEGGTRSHRFSYSEPPLQQMPSPDKDPRDAEKKLIERLAVGSKIRRVFLPEKGEFWVANDYSQQEPRITVHMAAACNMRGVETALESYRNNARTDYHTMVADMTGLVRPRAKILNLALTYGKGLKAVAEELGVSLEEAKAMMEMYFEKLPFIKPLEELCKRMAANRGYIRLIDGARVHYNDWEGGWVDWEEKQKAIALGLRFDACSIEEAQERQKDPRHPWSKVRLRRADTRKALNNLVQGSAARQTKKAMLGMWREGILPLIQMHDELGASCGEESQANRIAEIMRDAVPLKVPVIVDTEVGNSWGTAKLSWADAEKKYGRATS
jgi:DNA polymerase I-like protein with 3'-5' exonuclease and polymerase domains